MCTPPASACRVLTQSTHKPQQPGCLGAERRRGTFSSVGLERLNHRPPAHGGRGQGVRDPGPGPSSAQRWSSGRHSPTRESPCPRPASPTALPQGSRTTLVRWLMIQAHHTGPEDFLILKHGRLTTAHAGNVKHKTQNSTCILILAFNVQKARTWGEEKDAQIQPGLYGTPGRRGTFPSFLDIPIWELVGDDGGRIRAGRPRRRQSPAQTSFPWISAEGCWEEEGKRRSGWKNSGRPGCQRAAPLPERS